MIDMKTPKEALLALENIQDLLGNSVLGVYLYGSAVIGGLQNNSDVDVMVVVNHRLTEITRKELADRLLSISGKIGNKNSVRPLEVTVVNYDDIIPWKYPPRKEFIYGEWLRGEIECGHVPESSDDPDLAILLCQIRYGSIPLVGRAASEVFEPVPMTDVNRAMAECLPSLIECTVGDERNVILTLARMWVTASTGEFLAKDMAADWVVPRLPQHYALLLKQAASAYRGEYKDTWEELSREVTALVRYMKKEIEPLLLHNECVGDKMASTGGI